MAQDYFRFNVGEPSSGERLDVFLTTQFAGRYSRSFLQRLIASGRVTVDSRIAKGHHKVKMAEAIEVTIPPSAPSDLTAEAIPLNIVYEDEDIAVVDKPSGMVVHPAPGNYSGTLANALLGHFGDLSGVAGASKPGIVHRLDKGTSGLLVVAKNDTAHRELARQFKARTIKRVYTALVRGVVRFDNGVIDLPIGRDRRDRKKMAVDPESPRTALTSYRVLERFKDFTMLELRLGTGRTHQIRVHISHIGHPIVGDAEYGGRGGMERPALHAGTLGFIHPRTGRQMEFESNLPRDMKELISRKHL
jgi:23S rRNA pseudouridine1911/1915/1917 synthase